MTVLSLAAYKMERAARRTRRGDDPAPLPSGAALPQQQCGEPLAHRARLSPVEGGSASRRAARQSDVLHVSDFPRASGLEAALPPPQCGEPLAHRGSLDSVKGGSASVSLAPNDVHVWRVPLNRNLDRLRTLQRVLSANERERAQHFRFTKDRCQFIEARVALRFILSQYLNVVPEEIEFTKGIHGKPELVGHDLRFNLSRREGLALIAVTRGREIGIDVERVLDDFPVAEIAESNFSNSEIAALQKLSKDEQTAGFFNCWTRKEAYVKARGAGLLFPLKQFDVSLAPGAEAQLLGVRDDETIVDRWTLQEIPVSEGYVAALAVNGVDLNVTCRDWKD